MSAPEFDQYLNAYSAEIEDVIGVFGKKQEFFAKYKADILLHTFATIRSNISDLTVLDVGCGTGMIHPYIAPSLPKLRGADLSGASLEIARKNNPTVHYDLYDGRTLPYGDAIFDCAYAICVLHHVPVDQWTLFVKDMCRVVKPGGLILFIEHNPLNPATRWVVNNCKFDANATLLTAWKLRKLLSAAGTVDPWVQYILFTPFASKVFRKLDRLLSKLPFGAQYVIGARVPNH